MPPDSIRALEVRALPRDPKLRRRSELAVSHALGVPMAAAHALLLNAPLTLPGPSDAAARDALADALTEAQTDVVEVTLTKARPPCAVHPALDADAVCDRCGLPTCAVCIAISGRVRCAGCAAREAKSGRFFRLRVAALLLVLIVVLLYAAGRTLSNRARTEWNRPLSVAFILVQDGPADAAANAALQRRIPALEEALSREMQRFRASAQPPVTIKLIGPTKAGAPPDEPRSDGFVDLALYTYRRWRWTRAIDHAAHLDDAGRYDARIYIVERTPVGRVTFVEGASEQGGRVGIVTCDLDLSTVDWVLSVGAHELFHTLGATDKYDAAGHARVPAGLADPSKVPLYPQNAEEIMTSGVPLSPNTERPLETLSELRVGRDTAREIGWLAP